MERVADQDDGKKDKGKVEEIGSISSNVGAAPTSHGNGVVLDIFAKNSFVSNTGAAPAL